MGDRTVANIVGETFGNAWDVIRAVPLVRLAAEHAACEGFNPAVMRELAEHCLKGQICYPAWEDELDGIIERLRT